MTHNPRLAEPHQVLRALATVTASTPSGGALEVARVDLILATSGYYVGDPETFISHCRQSAAAPFTSMPADLSQALSGDSPADVVVIHDGPSPTVPAVLTGRLPWISTSLLAAQVWPHAEGYDLVSLVTRRGLHSHIDTLPGSASLSGAALAAVQTAVLVAELHADTALRSLPQPACAATERWLRPVLGEVLGDAVLQRMLHLSQASTRSLRPAVASGRGNSALEVQSPQVLLRRIP